jgi:preprotein translocase subunit SecB
MSDKSADKKDIAPEFYRKILNGLELKNLYLTSCISSIDRNNIGTDVKIKIDDEAAFSKSEKNEIEITQKYSIDAKNQTSKRKFLNIKCEYCFVYTSREDFTEEFFEVFKRANLPINSWPFFRELVCNITSRMYIPPLVLPLIKR